MAGDPVDAGRGSTTGKLFYHVFSACRGALCRANIFQATFLTMSLRCMWVDRGWKIPVSLWIAYWGSAIVIYKPNL